MRKAYCLGMVICLGTLFSLGCSETVAPPSTSGEATTQAGEEETNVAVEEETSATGEEEYSTKVAGVGATGKGEYGVTSEEPMSIITVPISTYFKAQERAVFDMQIPQAMNLFNGAEGRYPNSEQEFFQRIINDNQIQLPKLPEGDSYFYDVPSHTLMIKTKK